MSDPFLGAIHFFAFDWPPMGWARCDGQILNISQNNALYSLLGTSYGGDGRTTFGLPDLRGRTPLHNLQALGQKGGAESVTLTAQQVPQHNHTVAAATAAASTNNPAGSVFAAVPTAEAAYGTAANLASMAATTVDTQGGGQGHSNLQPSLTINACIALMGIYPSRN